MECSHWEHLYENEKSENDGLLVFTGHSIRCFQ